MAVVETKALVLGRREARMLTTEKRYYTWLKVPALWDNKILTIATDEEFLPYGTRTADAILVRVDPQSLRHDGLGFVAELEVVDVWEGSSEADERQEKEAEG